MFNNLVRIFSSSSCLDWYKSFWDEIFALCDSSSFCFSATSFSFSRIEDVNSRFTVSIVVYSVVTHFLVESIAGFLLTTFLAGFLLTTFLAGFLPVVFLDFLDAI